MANSTGHGSCVGAVRQRSHALNPLTRIWTKRGQNGQFMDGKSNGRSFNSVRKEQQLMAIRNMAIHLTGGQTHEHISHLWWTNPADGKTGNNTRGQIVEWIEKDGKAYVDDQQGHRADLRVVTPLVGQKYLRTHADGKPTDDLLALPHK